MRPKSWHAEESRRRIVTVARTGVAPKAASHDFELHRGRSKTGARQQADECGHRDGHCNDEPKRIRRLRRETCQLRVVFDDQEEEERGRITPLRLGDVREADSIASERSNS